MATEVNRKLARKRVYLLSNPDGTPDTGSGSYVDLPVIVQITFKHDGSEQYWEYEYNVDNSSESNREVHVDKVYCTEEVTPDGSTGAAIDVERVDSWPIKADGSDLYQQTRMKLDNTTGADTIPPSFTSHAKTHVIKYVRPDDDSVWIKTEVIDRLRVKGDGSEQYWQHTWVLANSDKETDDTDYTYLDEISDTPNGVDPPWRTDPFQNIVDFSPGGIAVLFLDGDK